MLFRSLSQRYNEEAPQIILECVAAKKVIWRCDLAEVDDDLESLYLKVGAAKLATCIFLVCHLLVQLSAIQPEGCSAGKVPQH